MSYHATLAMARARASAVQDGGGSAAAKTMQQAIGEDLRRLARSDAFEAILAVILQHEAAYATSAARQDLAAHAGSLQHCAGSLYAMQNLLGSLREIIDVDPQKLQRKRSGLPRSEPVAES